MSLSTFAKCPVRLTHRSSERFKDKNISRLPINEQEVWEIEKARIPMANGHYRSRNVEESKIHPYNLPSLWNSSKATLNIWQTKRRLELLDLFKTNIYGEIPPPPDCIEVEVMRTKLNALNNSAIRKEMRLHFFMNNGAYWNFDMLIYMPKRAQKKFPVWIMLNFNGNQDYTPDTDVLLTRGTCEAPGRWYATKPVPESFRGDKLEFGNYKNAIEHGYAVATACYGEIFPDHPLGIKQSIYTLFYSQKELNPYPGTNHLRPYGAISAWAWGLSRMLDALTVEPQIDINKAAVIGHSRLGKTALWAGANDERFKLVVSNNSGCMGASLSRRNFGENVLALANMRDYWFCEKFLQYAGDITTMPIDQHALLSLIAPRALYIGSSSEDYGADPRGEFLALQAAAPIWQLYGKKTNIPSLWPPIGKSVGESIRYHIKSGKHSLTQEDWNNYYNFSDWVFEYNFK